MNTNTSTRLLFARALAAGAFLLVVSPALRADDKKHGEHGEHSHAEMANNSTEALKQIHSLHAKLVSQVKGKELKSVHETAEQLTAVLKSLPGLSKDLPTDKQKRVEGTVNNLAKALDALHDAADEGDQAGSEKHLGTVESLIKVLVAQYPASAHSGHKM